MTVTLTGLETEVYAGSMVQAYIDSDVLLNVGMQYFGMRPTEKINLPVVHHGQGQYLADGADHTGEDASIDGVEIELWLPPFKLQNHIKYSDIEVHPDHDYIANLGRSHGASVGRNKNRVFTNFLTKTADTAGNVIQADENNATMETARESMRNAVQEIMAEMDQAGVPGFGRYGLLNPSAFYKLNTTEGVIRLDWGGPANVQNINKRTVLDYLNVMIRMMPDVFGTDWDDTPYAGIAMPAAATFDQTNFIGVFWHMDAWAMREQTQPDSQVDNIPEKQIVQVLSRQIHGAAALQTDGIWALQQA